VVIFIDPPTWPGHGRLWSHMVSDTSYAELHDFAASVGIPPRAFERDHYDVIVDRYESVVAAGAHRATSREIVAMLHRAGLRRRHRSVLAPPLGRVWPAPLVPGDLVAVVSPSGPVAPDRLTVGVALLESWGLRVRLEPRVLAAYQPLTYLASDDRGRADDVTTSWTDPSVAAVWAARGGYGAQRMVDLVDWSALRRAGRKWLVGFSDITALHTRLGRDLDQVTVHGPVLGSTGQLDDAESVAALRALIMEPPRAGTVLVTGRSAVAGVGQGRLVGGNLSLVAADVGVEPPPEVSSIAVFEDVGEDGYRIDRMLTQLLRSRWFDQVTGVLVGEFSPVSGASPSSSGLAAVVIADRLERLRIPVITEAAVGHGTRNLALPLGAAVTLAAGPPGTPGTLTLAST
jgi:muramoyltetrapeptide carboxypeptidase